MEAMAEFFEWLNRMLGVEGPADLIFNPWFIGLMILGFIYSFIKGWKFFTIGIFALMGGAVIYKYTFPEDTSDLRALLSFMGSLGVLSLVIIYLAFIRET